jgi:hypothetical protein
MCCLNKTIPMLRGISLFLPAILTLCLSSGCASMLDGPEQTILLHCTPSDGVTVLVDGVKDSFVDGTITLAKSRETHFVTFSRAGYNSSTISFNREIEPFWPIADLIWGPAFPVAWFVDWQTNSLYRIDPKDVRVVLRKAY